MIISRVGITTGVVDSLVDVEELRFRHCVGRVRSLIDCVTRCDHLRGGSHLTGSRAVAGDSSVIHADIGAFDVAFQGFAQLVIYVRPGSLIRDRLSAAHAFT